MQPGTPGPTFYRVWPVPRGPLVPDLAGAARDCCDRHSSPPALSRGTMPGAVLIACIQWGRACPMRIRGGKACEQVGEPMKIMPKI